MGRRPAPEPPSPGRLRRACVGRRPAPAPRHGDARALPDRALRRPRRRRAGVVVRGRVLDDPPGHRRQWTARGSGPLCAARVRHFLTDELPGVPLRDHGRRTRPSRRSPTATATSWSASHPTGRARRARGPAGPVELARGLPRPARHARHAGRGAGPGRRRPLRDRLRRRRHDPRDRRPAGRCG